MGESKDTSSADYDYEYDEKHKTGLADRARASTTPRSSLGVENLYLAENGSLVNHLIQSLKARVALRARTRTTPWSTEK